MVRMKNGELFALKEGLDAVSNFTAPQFSNAIFKNMANFFPCRLWRFLGMGVYTTPPDRGP